MKKNLKKISSLVLTFIMAMMMILPVAAAGELPKETDTAQITVTGIEAGAKVTAYRIVKPVYDEAGGYSGYVAVLENSIADVTNPTAAEIFALAGRKSELTDIAEMQGDAAGYTATVNAGTWIVLVDAAEGKSLAKVYNPMIVSASYKDNALNAGSVSGDGIWLEDGTTIAKATEPTVKKVIVKDDNTEVKGDDQAIGGKFNFKVSSQIPSYGSEYTKITYKLTDELSDGLTLDKDSITVKVGNVVVPASDDKYTLTTSANGYVIEFKEAYVRNHGQDTVEITYSATLNDKAVSGFDPDKNTVTLDYSTKFDGTTSAKKDETKHYTFGIDSSLTGQSGVTTITKTHEIIKVAADTYVEGTYTDEQYTNGIVGALAGAKFTLYKEDGITEVKKATSDATGHLEFTGLDAGTYKLKETKAPSGYKLDETVHTVVISADYAADGILQSYTVTIDGEATSTYTASYNADGTIQIINKGTNITSIFKNTKIGELPSTGGIGTYLFTIAGAFIMALALGMLIIRKRHN